MANLSCLACNRSYADIDPYLVDTLPGQGLAAWCTECDPVISLGEKKSHITTVVNKWREWGIVGDMDAIEDAGHRFVERELWLKSVKT